MNKKVALILLILILCNIVAYSLIFKKDNNLKVIFFDVGQGDSIFIETSQGHQILVDGGPNNSVLNNLEKFMNPFDKSIDMVILTHTDKDHLGGLISVLKIYDVDVFVWTGAASDSNLFYELNELLANKKVVTVDAFDKIWAGDIELQIYNPIKDVNTIKDSNATSIVFKLIHGNSKFLLTGDLPSNFEDDLIEKFNLKSSILKVGHHGSKYSTSEEFVKAVYPSCAIISVGKNNYGHPAEEVLNLLQDNNIKTLRTDTHGNIVFYSNKENIFLKK